MLIDDEILYIEEFGDIDVYDISLENDPHNFLANGIVVHNCSYFKANYSLEFYAIAINESIEKSDAKDNPVENIVKEAQFNGIRLNLPKYNLRSSVCACKGDGIVYGLNMIKGLTEKVAAMIDLEFESFSQFCKYVILNPKLNKKHVKTLIQLGYFEDFGAPKLLWSVYQQEVWEYQNSEKYDEWQKKKENGKRVREFTELKFQEEELIGTKKEWLLDLIGFEWESKLHEVLADIDEDIKDNPDYIIGEVGQIKTGISKYNKPWSLITLKTIEGDKKGFLTNGAMRIQKGEVLVCRYSAKGDTYSFDVRQRH